MLPPFVARFRAARAALLSQTAPPTGRGPPPAQLSVLWGIGVLGRGAGFGVGAREGSGLQAASRIHPGAPTLACYSIHSPAMR